MIIRLRAITYLLLELPPQSKLNILMKVELRAGSNLMQISLLNLIDNI